uniref:Uncharacterized protein n=1 Tax=Sphaerodactylus townsendi TaxID=933632 RepID=A0ACB8G457_9SAUR
MKCLKMRKMETVSRVARVPDELEGNLFPNADGKPSEWHPEDAVGSDNANPARCALPTLRSPGGAENSLTPDFVNQAESAADPELQMDGVYADWCQKDPRQDEFLKELKETAELADPKAIKVVPVQCQAVPEVEAKSVANALPTCPAVRLNDVPAERYREYREMVPVRGKEAVANASQRAQRCS